MTSFELDKFFKNLLDIESFDKIDSSLNGLQVDNDGSDIKKIAFAVDANLETFKRASRAKANMLFVHHGLFWGQALRLVGNHRKRLDFLLKNNIALYGVHLPLDQNPKFGNNIILANLLGIIDPQPFGTYNGKKLGYKGNLAKPLTIEEATKRISFMNRDPLGVYPFGVKENQTVALISGGAAKSVLEAIAENVDLYVTGDMVHSIYNECLEAEINMIAGGHYSTEVWGVRKIMEECTNQLKIDVEFIDVPTGL